MFKKLILSAVLALSFAGAMAATTTAASAEGRTIVNSGNGTGNILDEFDDLRGE